MNQDKLYQDFPQAVRCESSEAVIFVAIPNGARCGDVRKTLAGILVRPYSSINIAPFPPQLTPEDMPQSGIPAIPYDENDYVPDSVNALLRAQILMRDDAGGWVTW